MHFEGFSAPKLSGERFLVVYQIKGTEKEANETAKNICFEQTVEFPEDLVPEGIIRDDIVGKIESIDKINEDSFKATISYAVETTAYELTQLMNVIFGNSSIKPGIKVLEIIFSKPLLDSFKGPRFGRDGLRELLGVQKRPLLSTALKPMGLSPKDLGTLAYKFALGGIDLIKDDHGLTNQSFCSFKDRLNYCVTAIDEVNRKKGSSCLYVANITAPHEELFERARYAKQNGAGALLIAPGLVGFDTMRALADDDSIGLPLISHPAFLGSFVVNDFGMSHKSIIGQLTRLSGADATIYPNFGGRFSFSKEECTSIVESTACDMGHIKPIFPSPGGGMSLELVPDLMKVYGNDAIFLVGGGLFKHSNDIVENSLHFLKLVETFE